MNVLLTLGGALALSAALVAQTGGEKVLTATVTLKSTSRTIAVHGKAAGANQQDFMFCLDRPRTGGAAPLAEFTGPARVIYRPVPVPGIPESLAATTPENVASALTVIADNGQAWIFVAKGQAPLQPPTGATTVPVSLVRKTDWSPGTGPRRGTDISSCLIAAG